MSNYQLSYLIIAESVAAASTPQRFLNLKSRCSLTSAQAFAPGTWSNIKSHGDSYLKFCDSFFIRPFPISEVNVTPFLQLYSESASVRCFNTVANVLSSIKTLSKMNGYMPTDVELFHIDLFMRGLKRNMGSYVHQMLPVTPHLLAKLYKCLDFSNSFYICMWSAMLVMFYSFFRKSNVLPMSRSTYDSSKQMSRSLVMCYEDYLLVRVTWSKTIQYCQQTLYIPLSSVPGSILCPVAAYNNLLKAVPVPGNDPAFCYRCGQSYVPLTYPMFVNQFRKWLLDIGILHVNLYSSHSFRRGGATWAFQSGVPHSLIKLQGDWQSDCYLQYIKHHYLTGFFLVQKWHILLSNLNYK